MGTFYPPTFLSSAFWHGGARMTDRRRSTLSSVSVCEFIILVEVVLFSDASATVINHLSYSCLSYSYWSSICSRVRAGSSAANAKQTCCFCFKLKAYNWQSMTFTLKQPQEMHCILLVGPFFTMATCRSTQKKWTVWGLLVRSWVLNIDERKNKQPHSAAGCRAAGDRL